MKNFTKSILCLFMFSFAISCRNDDDNSNQLEADVYVVGRVHNSTTTSYAKIWKNNNATSLTNGTTIAGAHSVFVYNDDIYVAGYGHDGNRTLAKYWKNGVENNIPTISNNSQAWLSSIFVENNTIYVAG